MRIMNDWLNHGFFSFPGKPCLFPVIPLKDGMKITEVIDTSIQSARVFVKMG